MKLPVIEVKALLDGIATGAPLFPSPGDIPGLVGLALVPGLAALLIYYRGLQSTPAARATIAELAFPITAAVVCGAARIADHLWPTVQTMIEK